MAEKRTSGVLGDGRIMTLGLAAMVGFMLVALVGWMAGVARPPTRPLGVGASGDSTGASLTPGVVGVLPGIIRESSGVAMSGFDPTLLWTHNDGSEARLFLLRRSGALGAVVQVIGAEVDDAEDIATGPCPDGIAAASCLYLADTGDNDRDRDDYAILVAAEPEPSTLGGSVRSDITFERIRFRYPGGSRDSEALAVGPGGDILVVTKGQEGSAEVFRIAADLDAGGVAEAISAGTLPIDVDRDSHRVTGAALSRDGSQLVVRSDDIVWRFSADDLGTVVHTCSLTDSGQGEGIDFVLPDLFVVTREGQAAPIELIACP